MIRWRGNLQEQNRCSIAPDLHRGNEEPVGFLNRMAHEGNLGKRIGNIGEEFMLIWISTADCQARHFVLLDRDGVINADRPDYIKQRREFRFYEDALLALRWLHDRRIAVVVISNQSGLNRGRIAWEDFWDIHACLIEGVREAGGAILGAFYCPHRPDEGCSCRKPLPGLLTAASERFQFALAEAHFIGDRESDLLAASRAGCRGVLLERPGVTFEEAPLPARGDRTTPSFPNLMDAVLALSPAWRV